MIAAILAKKILRRNGWKFIPWGSKFVRLQLLSKNRKTSKIFASLSPEMRRRPIVCGLLPQWHPMLDPVGGWPGQEWWWVKDLAKALKIMMV